MDLIITDSNEKNIKLIIKVLEHRWPEVEFLTQNTPDGQFQIWANDQSLSTISQIQEESEIVSLTIGLM